MSKLQIISDMAALARAGFKMDDIKAIMAEPDTSAEKPAETTQEDVMQPEQEKEPEKEKPAEVKTEPDYKKMYEELSAKQDKLENDLKAAQAFNTSKSVETKTESAEDKINNIFRDIIS